MLLSRKLLSESRKPLDTYPKDVSNNKFLSRKKRGHVYSSRFLSIPDLRRKSLEDDREDGSRDDGGKGSERKHQIIPFFPKESSTCMYVSVEGLS